MLTNTQKYFTLMTAIIGKVRSFIINTSSINSSNNERERNSRKNKVEEWLRPISFTVFKSTVIDDLIIFLLFPLWFYSVLKNNLSLRRHISSISSQATLLLDIDQKKHHYLPQKSGTLYLQLAAGQKRKHKTGGKLHLVCLPERR